MAKNFRFRTPVLYKLPYYYWGLVSLLSIFGWMAMGSVGIILTVWILLLWYSVWQRPYRFELMLIASLGLLGAVALLPSSLWDNYFWMWAFLVVAASPVVDLLILTFRSKA